VEARDGGEINGLGEVQRKGVERKAETDWEVQKKSVDGSAFRYKSLRRFRFTCNEICAALQSIAMQGFTSSLKASTFKWPTPTP